MLISDNLERATRWAAIAHQGQTRRGSRTPYVQHVFAVAMILDRLGFAEPVVIAGLLHDIVEDTEATFNDVEGRFGPEVTAMVRHCTEVKNDEQGRKRPWIDRKRSHLAALAEAPADARSVLLADKLHNLTSILHDLHDGIDVWPSFHADRESILWYYRTAVETFGKGSVELDRLAAECLRILEEIEAFSPRL